MRYRLDVVAPCVVDAVRHAGGWLVDRVMAGWDVTVLIDGDEDVRPLAILGVDTMELEGVLKSWENRPHPQTVAVAADLFNSDKRVRYGVLGALEQGLTEVTLWGEECPADLSVRPARHELSAAARAFKAQALTAAKHPDATSVGATETFRTGTMISRSVPADLIPAS
ncbi:hypothetical protein [Mycolicibacterium goodii]|uniref:Uncharacterized protein n=1 Tax=Mycolicibacterium goodii TaxID=134601 RepID=A0ABS6HI33_MYCGD|nr:hypothetical protein [Mycolicibacterium goodii]OKH69752.1 hypothetical protein EB74_29225 [Mycobacterium sp. SWH-M5]MBU8810464.1 hypothetical protein [Mycolicibacterium goodii]MBU8816078.1 hypothetical protein [Mycolicibacterium goodii]MBU8821349.1 hypothetical protein [Mycolicibacterium goodii]MBU8831409.1 hypothetical protein [Mycolicibacterium goodii]